MTYSLVLFENAIRQLKNGQTYCMYAFLIDGKRMRWTYKIHFPRIGAYQDRSIPYYM